MKLTRKQIETMERGREMDVWVASLVCETFVQDRLPILLALAREGKLYPNDGGEYIGPPFFSTNVHAAWEVAECLREDGWEVIVASHKEGWEVELAMEDGSRPCVIVRHEMITVALCRAALMTTLN